MKADTLLCIHNILDHEHQAPRLSHLPPAKGSSPDDKALWELVYCNQGLSYTSNTSIYHQLSHAKLPLVTPKQKILSKLVCLSFDEKQMCSIDGCTTRDAPSINTLKARVLSQIAPESHRRSNPVQFSNPSRWIFLVPVVYRRVCFRLSTAQAIHHEQFIRSCGRLYPSDDANILH